ncbi:hypothetical protein IQ07DRAFT_428090 [Pyrenochaeta sp. DS3sAY3a]|nr:hypothetical protein IQ07DRAFT_428090 [Pyrenochaeta sp. DS3sAY3a]
MLLSCIGLLQGPVSALVLLPAIAANLSPGREFRFPSTLSTLDIVGPASPVYTLSIQIAREDSTLKPPGKPPGKRKRWKFYRGSKSTWVWTGRLPFPAPNTTCSKKAERYSRRDPSRSR